MKKKKKIRRKRGKKRKSEADHPQASRSQG